MKRSGPASKFKRTNFPRYARAANIIGAAYKAYKGSPKQKYQSKKANGLNGITTFQKDVKQVYRYKRAPKRLRSKWKRSRKAFTSNLLKQEASRKFHYHGSQAWTSAANAQAWYGWTSYGVAGQGSADGTGDIGDIFTRLTAELLTQGTLAQQSNNGNLARRFYFDTMRSRVVLTNTGTNPIFWEIYECMARKDIPLTEGNSIAQLYAYAATVLQQGFENSLSGGPGIAGVHSSAVVLPPVTSSGVTPFQYRHFCQNFKIHKVTRLQAAPGNTVSFDAGDRRNLTINYDNYSQLIMKAGVSKIYVVRQWGAVTTANPNNSPSSASFEIERDYNVKVLDQSVPQLNYMTYT